MRNKTFTVYKLDELKPEIQEKVIKKFKFVVLGFKWFDKVNGNTYHAVKIIKVSDVENVIIFESGLTYGYGDQYRHTAYDWLVKNGYVQEVDRNDHDLNRNRFIYVVQDVQRKKDLKAVEVE